MAVLLSPVGGVAAQFFDNNGNPLTGGKLYSYSAGTTTPAATYTSSLGTTAHTNPIVLDAGGRVPGGEIWLTDGVIYKFVLQTSTNVLIATYDNIVGINSNFVNYTASQEIQTATAGQTVFNLATTQYQPGTNSLSVFVDGVNQYGPGAQYAYLETDSDTVTFVTGLHVGASVKFTTTTQTTGNATDASVVTYDPPFANSVVTDVEAKLSQYVSVIDFGAVGDGVADDTVAIQNALNSGAKLISIPNGTYKLTNTLYIPEGATLKGAGKAATTLTCSSDFTPIAMQNVDDASLEGVLIIADSTQTTALIALNATTKTITRCSIKNVQGSGSATDFPFISAATTNGAYGNWAHLIDNVSVSGCGTVFRAETAFANSWINSICLRHVYANDFIRGINLIETSGDGASSCTFFDWAAQTSARTQFGALIGNASVLGKQIGNSFTDVRFYDLIAPAQEYFIGSNVLDTTIQGLSVDTLIPARITDEGVGTVVKGMSFPDYFTYNGRTINVPTSTGFTSDTSGTGTTQQLAPYIQLRTGGTLGSLARLYTTNTVSGLSQNQLFNVDFGLPLKISFLLTRIDAGASSVGRIQLKTTQSDGSLAAKGIGLQINNYSVFGESYGSTGATVNLGLTLTDAETYKIDIVHYPALRIEWWVNGVLASKTSTVANIPSGSVACYLQNSLSNVAANDVQMFVSAIQLKSPNS